jgi:hypothetical protein
LNHPGPAKLLFGWDQRRDDLYETDMRPLASLIELIKLEER